MIDYVPDMSDLHLYEDPKYLGYINFYEEHPKVLKVKILQHLLGIGNDRLLEVREITRYKEWSTPLASFLRYNDDNVHFSSYHLLILYRIVNTLMVDNLSTRDFEVYFQYLYQEEYHMLYNINVDDVIERDQKIERMILDGNVKEALEYSKIESISEYLLSI